MKKKRRVDDAYYIKLWLFWETKRRNENYRRDYEKNQKGKIDQTNFQNKWGIPPTDPNLTFDEMLEAYGYHTQYYKGLKRHPFPIEQYLDPRWLNFGPPIGVEIPINLINQKQLKLVPIVLNLNYTTEEIKSALDDLLERIKAAPTPRGKILEVWERRFKVWDLREQCYPYKEINYLMGYPGIDTVVKDYQNAFEEIYRRPYDPTKLKKEIKKSQHFKKKWETCEDKNCFKENQLCPHFAKCQVEGYDEKLKGGDEGDKLLNYHSYKEWQKNNK